jgi:hypothetical protein
VASRQALLLNRFRDQKETNKGGLSGFPILAAPKFHPSCPSFSSASSRFRCSKTESAQLHRDALEPGNHEHEMQSPRWWLRLVVAEPCGPDVRSFSSISAVTGLNTRNPTSAELRAVVVVVCTILRCFVSSRNVITHAP